MYPKILSVRPAPFGAGERTIAFIDVEISENLRLYNLALRSTSGGRMRTFSPNAMGKHTATFTPALAELITQAAVAALPNGSNAANDSTCAAA